MKNLFKISGGLMWAVLGKIAAMIPADLVDDLNEDPKMIDAMVKGAIDYKAAKVAESVKNPYEQSLERQLAALRCANDEEKWGLTEEDFDRLAWTAPAWPQGKHAYRSFRIRFGEGDEGVVETYEKHCAYIKSVFTERYYGRPNSLLSCSVPDRGTPVERLRLLNGNDTHHAVVEWVVADLDTHRQRESVAAVRGSSSLADELLVIGWLFPDMIRAIDYCHLAGMYAGGYEVGVTTNDSKEWRYVVIVHFGDASRRVRILVGRDIDADSGCSVPSLRKSLVLGG